MRNKTYDELSLMDFNDIPDCDLFQKAEMFNAYSCEVKKRHHYNFRRISLSGSGPVMEVQDPYTGKIHEMIYFGSNDYLNLTKHPRTIAAGIKALEKYGTGAGSVPLLGGTLDLHNILEEKIARFKGCREAIIYTSGYGSNCSTLLSLMGSQDIVFLDILDHASIFDGCKNTNTRLFRHNDPDSLIKKLEKAGSQFRTKLVVLDGVYSMDGDICLLDEIIRIARQYKAYVMIDEAHATGVIGKTGRGTPEYFQVEGQVDIVAGTFSKGLGAVGGFIAANNPALIEYLRFYSRGYMFSTAMTPQAAASLIEGLDVIVEEEGLRNKLWENIHYFRSNLLRLGYNTGNSQTAIFPIIIGNDTKVKEACYMLHEQGIYANPVLYPAVRKSESRIRMSLMAAHTREHLDRTLNVLEDIHRKLGLKQESSKQAVS